MPQVTVYVNKDARIAQSGSTELGAGASPSSPIGTYSGYTYRTLLGFPVNFTGWTAITDARLYCYTSDQNYVSFGSSPSLKVNRLQDPWSEGSSVGMSTGNAVIWPGPNAFASGEVSKNPPTSINTLWSVDITAIMQAAFAAGVFHGLRLSGASTSAADVTEIWTREKSSGYRAYIVITYESNRAPNAPTPASPGDGSLERTNNPTFGFSASDPDSGDTMSKYDLQVGTDPNWGSASHWNVQQTTGISGWSVWVAYAGAALTPGATYYWRTRVYDAAGVVSGWSPTRSFVRNAMPTVSHVSGGGLNFVAPIHNIGEAVDPLQPKPFLQFALNDPGDTIYGYQLDISGVITEVSGTWGSGQWVSHYHDTALLNGGHYSLRYRARDAEGWGPWSSSVVFSVKFMQAVYQFDLSGANGITVSAPPATLLYRTATASGGGGTVTPWTPNIPPALASPGWLNVMLRTFSQGNAPTQPSVPRLQVNYQTGVAPMPLSWEIQPDTSTFSVDSNARKYGTKSLRFTAPAVNGSYRFASQNIENLTPDTDYTFSVWVKANALTGGGAYLEVTQPDRGAYLALAYVDGTKPDWQRLIRTVRLGSGDTRVRLTLGQEPGVVAPSVIQWDAVMVSEGTVAPVWTPALTGAPVILDANGILVNGQAGGLLRVLNPYGSPIEMGAGSDGITFGQDLVLKRYSEATLAVAAANPANAAQIVMSGSGAGQAEGAEVHLGGANSEPGWSIDTIMGTQMRVHTGSAGVMLNLNSTVRQVLAPFFRSEGFRRPAMGDAASRWWRIGWGRLVAQYHYESCAFTLFGRYGYAEVVARVNTDAGMGVQPVVNLRERVFEGNGYSVFLGVMNTNPMEWQVWARTADNWADMFVIPRYQGGDGEFNWDVGNIDTTAPSPPGWGYNAVVS